MTQAAEKQNHNYESLLVEILSLSKSMLEHAHDGDWDSVATIASDRESFVITMPDASMTGISMENAKQMLESILEVNQQLEALGREEMNRCATEVKKVVSNKVGAKAYGAL